MENINLLIHFLMALVSALQLRVALANRQAIKKLAEDSHERNGDDEDWQDYVEKSHKRPKRRNGSSS